MGSAMIRALQKQQHWYTSIAVVEPDQEKRAALKKRYNITTAATAHHVVPTADIIVLAVKPQVSEVVCGALCELIQKNSLVISIMAGVSTQSLRHWLHHDRIVRAMPNSPAQIGLGMTVWKATGAVRASHLRMVQLLFNGMGVQFRVATDDLIDKATAVSGSGPAYLFAYTEWLTAAAQMLGFTKQQATLMVRQTVIGAAQLLKESGEDASILRARVTSKKGTTDKALRSMKKNKMPQSVQHAVTAAYRRAKELARGAR